MSDSPKIPVHTRALVMSRFDRAVLRFHFGKHETEAVDPEPAPLFGIELRVNPIMPEGIAAAVDSRGNLLCLLDMRGDHARPSSPPAPSETKP